MKTLLVEGFSKSVGYLQNTIFCGKFLPLGDQKGNSSNASSTKDFFGKKRKRKKRPNVIIFQGKKI
jgi:hypothetical protein